MDKKIVLARHGETIFNRDGFIMGRSDSSLTPEGLSAAKQVARLIEEQKIRTVFCSPLGRTRRSAEIYTEGMGLPSTCTRGYGGTFMWRVGGKAAQRSRRWRPTHSKDLAGQASRRGELFRWRNEGCAVHPRDHVRRHSVPYSGGRSCRREPSIPEVVVELGPGARYEDQLSA